ncbi:MULTISPECIES: hypothetical protein [unclassified Novosphingobium]|uniref:hypothetical protein n=1 Tax=unclassified Novosphingobium TaxID=2644732 RepID=UPI000D318DBD|nr:MULTISPECIES: hypothetical protein [unclassified Novosphingobium]PTR06465.1 hypothetical protein C8K11_12078 [Novosphingobium sp. GV055]PUA94884.1 hypothetical protein C8K12_12078 [Novosphingobium sp. GV061]PUB13809.1 hypothetical protein C8K14_12078 [Novosphingobium sp. GV079]PUB38507.1 hypothetical protein C8K10_12078 [Novosphingobium sp. GV027]
MPAKSIARLAEIGRRKVALTDQLAKLHAEECTLLTDLLAKHGPSAGVDEATVTAASQPKTQ